MRKVEFRSDLYILLRTTFSDLEPIRKFIVEVVFPTPPLWLGREIVFIQIHEPF
jgi:hypothetical protein